ncbi:MAG: hypothetical protein U0X75_26025 [Acidobacteriota bacterium]
MTAFVVSDSPYCQRRNRHARMLIRRLKTAFMPTEQTPPKVFISYSHDSQEHFDRVLLPSDERYANGGLIGYD